MAFRKMHEQSMLYSNIPIVLNGFSECDYTKSTFIELYKAFDTVHHIIVLTKLSSVVLEITKKLAIELPK